MLGSQLAVDGADGVRVRDGGGGLGKPAERLRQAADGEQPANLGDLVKQLARGAQLARLVEKPRLQAPLEDRLRGQEARRRCEGQGVRGEGGKGEGGRGF